MEDNNNNKNNDNIVEIDKTQYEKLALIGMEWGIDDPTEFLNAVLYYQMRREQEKEEEQGR